MSTLSCKESFLFQTGKAQGYQAWPPLILYTSMCSVVTYTPPPTHTKLQIDFIGQVQTTPSPSHQENVIDMGVSLAQSRVIYLWIKNSPTYANQ